MKSWLANRSLGPYPAWQDWAKLLDQLDDKVEGAFAGKVNLHEYEAQIDQAAETYQRLRNENQVPRAGGAIAFRASCILTIC